jgi:phosphohistidine phosphatase SixA
MRRAIAAFSAALCLLLPIGVLHAAAGDVLGVADATRLLKRGGVVLLLRHGQTEPGLGDPPGFKLDNCATQRNLSPSGKSELRDMAVRAASAGVRFAKAFTSQWCRCRETADILFGKEPPAESWPALNSQFADNTVVEGANAQVLRKIQNVPAKESWLMVTHQVNITALTGVAPASGEGVLVRPARDGLAVIGRVRL